MPQFGLYQTPDYLRRSQGYGKQAMQAYGMQNPSRPEPEKTIGGGLQSAGAGAASGAMVGAKIGGQTGGGWGAAIGGAIGLGAYLLS